MFSPGFYNQQRSSYVGSPLGEYMNLLPYAQQRYDVAKEALDDTDVFLNSVEHLEGDRESLYQITSPFRDRITEARESGDFRSMYDDIKTLSKKVGGDKGIKTIQQSYLGAMKQKELEATYGTQALSFSDPSKHQSIKVDEKGNVRYEVYTPHVEKRADYDKRITDIWSILKADGMPINLQDHKGAIDGFLKYGSWKGISDAKITGYLEKAMDRYIESPEGEQDYRRLTRIEGMSPEEAVSDIQRRMLSVGSGMVYSDVDMRYLEDPRAEAKAAAASMASTTFDQGYVPTGQTTTARVGDLFGNRKLEVNEEGKLVNEFNFGKEWSETYEKGKIYQVGNPVTGWLGNFVGSTLQTTYNALFGDKKELNLSNPTTRAAYDNMVDMAAAQYGVSPEQLTNQQKADFINASMENELNLSAPTVGMDEKTMKRYEANYIGEPVEVEDGTKVVQPKGMTANRFFYKGEPVTYQRLFGAENSEFGQPVAMNITRMFGAENPYGFPSGGVLVQATMKDGSTKEIPMETARDNRPASIVANAIYQAKANNITHSTVKPVEIPGTGIKASFRYNPYNETYAMYVNGEDKPVTFSVREELEGVLQEEMDRASQQGISYSSYEEMLASQKLTIEQLASLALLKKYARQ